MHSLLNSAIIAFSGSAHSTVRQLAAKLYDLPKFDEVSSPKVDPPLPDLEMLSSQPVDAPITREIIAKITDFPWQTVDPEVAPEAVIGKQVYCDIIGPEGILNDDNVRMGLYLQSPNVMYPSHTHNAEEVYYVLSGTALWKNGGGPFIPYCPGSLVHHPSTQPHAITTQDEMLLSVWAWFGDLSFDSYCFED